jgi:hypothetical protein
MFGSISGTGPGIDFGGGVVLPLVYDAYLEMTLNSPNLASFGTFRGQLDGSRQATATFTIPPGLSASLIGVTFNHAYLAAQTLAFPDLASNATPLTLVN